MRIAGAQSGTSHPRHALLLTAGPAAVAVILILSAGCALAGSADDARPSAASSNDSASTALGDAGLRSLTQAGVRFRALPLDQTNAFWSREYFFADGTYQGCADKVVLTGTYEIGNGLLCTRVGDRQNCRAVHRLGKNAYREHFLKGSPPETLASMGVEILPIRGKESCYRGE